MSTFNSVMFNYPDNSELDKWQKMDAVLFVIESTKCQAKICVILLSFSQVFMQDV